MIERANTKKEQVMSAYNSKRANWSSSTRQADLFQRLKKEAREKVR